MVFEIPFILGFWIVEVNLLWSTAHLSSPNWPWRRSSKCTLLLWGGGTALIDQSISRSLTTSIADIPASKGYCCLCPDKWLALKTQLCWVVYKELGLTLQDDCFIRGSVSCFFGHDSWARNLKDLFSYETSLQWSLGALQTRRILPNVSLMHLKCTNKQ